jgi:hypothetical protein
MWIGALQIEGKTALGMKLGSVSAVLEAKKSYHATAVLGRKDSCKSNIKTMAVGR